MRINNLSPVNKFQTVNAGQGMDLPEMQSETRVEITKAQPVSNVKQTAALEPESKNYEDEPLNEELLNKSIQQANKNLVLHNRVVERVVHDVTKTVMYTVRDTITNEIIAEFPPKRIQDMIAKMWEFAGLFVDEKA